MSKQLSPLQSIKLHCRECNGESKGGNKWDCLGRTCYLYPFKEGKGNYEVPESVPQEHKDYIESLGKDKVRKNNTMSDEQRKKASERMKELHKKKSNL